MSLALDVRPVNASNSPRDSSAPIAAPGWTLHEFLSLTSTNLKARALPAWHAVRAATQTGGYGRTGRSWVSDEGGLWLSAILPTPGPAAPWAILPLAAGWAVIEALESLGVKDLRIRWPNDIMVGRRKLAGLLLERFTADTAVVGLGLNVFNHPAVAEPTLAGTVITLDELLPSPGSLVELTAVMLNALANVHRILVDEGFSRLAAELSGHRMSTTAVELTLNGHHTPLRGRFRGIDESGRLRFTTPDGVNKSFAAHEVALLRELG